MLKTIEIRHGHVFCGLGGGARGFNRGQARVGSLEAKFRCVGGIDNDAAAIKDFERLTGVRGTVMDLFTREQYVAFHGKEPPAGWREATPADVRRAFNNERPNIGFMSSPCKGYSGLLSQAKSETARYQALNALALRGVWLYVEAFKDDPSEFLLFENVPRIQTRGRHLLDQIIQLLQHYGYAAAETTHDCGEIGGLAQSRKRFLLVARHREKVPPSLYQAPRKPLRAVGEVLDKLPLPVGGAGGPMHRMPALHWKTWVRLAFVEAGSDWRSLNKLKVEDGYLADYLIIPEHRNNFLGVCGWDEPAGTVQGESKPTNGKFSVADPRIDGHEKSVQLGVRRWDQTAGVVTGKMFVGGGPNAVADPRFPHGPAGPHFANVYRVVPWDATGPTVTTGKSPSSSGNSVADPRIAEGRFNNVGRCVAWDESSPAVTAGAGPSAGGLSIADPRCHSGFGGKGKYIVTPFGAPANTVIAASTTGNGASAVADPRVGYGPSSQWNKFAVTPWQESAKTVTGANQPQRGALSVADPRCRGLSQRSAGDDYHTGGHYGVVPWSATAYAVTGKGRYDNGFNNVADPRIALPGASDRLVAIIRALDNTWHRPFTTLELAALQGLVDPEEHLELEGLSDSAWRERIGNAVPSPAAEAIAGVLGRCLLGAMTGETFLLSSEPVWVRPVAVALSV